MKKKKKKKKKEKKKKKKKKKKNNKKEEEEEEETKIPHLARKSLQNLQSSGNADLMLQCPSSAARGG